jgi:phosphoribosylanthranilate isomerase
MMRTRVKICGLTRPHDVEAAVRAGADAIGLVFHPASPRAVDVEQARALCLGLPPFVTVVGLFVDMPAEGVRDILARVPLETLQFHGDETAEYCSGFGRRWIKAIRMRPDLDLRRTVEAYTEASGILLDAYQPGIAGGTGMSFDWCRIPSDLGPRIVLAGGLDPDNVAAAIRTVRPHAVDVSGGVESAKGVKDAEKIFAFMQGVSDGDSA